jgi:hypothetical protein
VPAAPLPPPAQALTEQVVHPLGMETEVIDPRT